MSDGDQIQHLSADEVPGLLGSRADGLTVEEVAERLREVGPNSVEVRDRYKAIRTLGKQFTNFFTILLIVSAGICFVAHALQPGESMNVLGFALFGVALLNATFAFIQEYRAERAMEALRHFLPPQVWVRRDRVDRRILADQLVPGDILIVSEGDRVAADARIVECDDLLVNNAPLTGESKPLSLTADAVDMRLSEAANVLFAGCSVLKGSARAVVFATGLRTEFGKLAHLSQAIRRAPSPLERATAQMVRVLTLIATSMGVAFFIYGVVTGRSLWVNLVFMMGIIVANVPEGLLPTFTLALAMGSLRMAKKNVLVKGLSAVEGLGAVHVICSDKTGTLTLNRLTITHISDASSGDGQADVAAERDILELALLASEVRETERGLSGDPLDVAVARRYAEGGGQVEAALASIQRHFAFDVQKRRSAGIGPSPQGARLAVKGAWEALRPMITKVAEPRGGPPVAATATALEAAERTVTTLASRGLRVIAVASRPLTPGETAETLQDELEHDLTLAGFLGIEDPVRPEVPAAVDRCRSAGIETIMITGDHPDTALAIAKRAGIAPEQASREAVLTGSELERSSQQDLIDALGRGVHIFARTTPEQKMKIVAALKEMDRVVAMTGDGVNDAPALKAADVGIAMGREGTDVARESAQIILLDDNFASIVAGIEEGRTVFSNIRKFTNYVLVSNGPEILPYLLYILLPVPLALTVIQILSIDLGTDIIPSMALGQEPPDADEMTRPPRERRQGLLSKGLIAHSYGFLGLLEGIWSLGLFFFVLVEGGWHWGQDLTTASPLYRSATGIALASILLMQIGNLLGRRYATRSGLDRGVLRNKLMVAGIIIQVVFSWATLYAPPVQAVLGTGPVAPQVYLLAWLGIPMIFGLDYWRKRIARRSR